MGYQMHVTHLVLQASSVSSSPFRVVIYCVSIYPMALVDALTMTALPPIDVTIGHQMQVAPLVLQNFSVSIVPIRVDSSLAGCIYFPWVKALFHEGCLSGLISLVENSTYERNQPSIPISCLQEPRVAPLLCLVPFANRWKCLRCLTSTPRSSPGLKAWISSNCSQASYGDPLSAVMIPSWPQLNIGCDTVHGSHDPHIIARVFLIHVALNFAADVMTDFIAARIQHPMHILSGVLLRCALAFMAATSCRHELRPCDARAAQFQGYCFFFVPNAGKLHVSRLEVGSCRLLR